MRYLLGSAVLLSALIRLSYGQAGAQASNDDFLISLPWAGEVEVMTWMLDYGDHKTFEGVFDVPSMPDDQSVIFGDLLVVRNAVLTSATKQDSSAILLHAISPEWIASCRWEIPRLKAEAMLCMVQVNPETERDTD